MQNGYIFTSALRSLDPIVYFVMIIKAELIDAYCFFFIYHGASRRKPGEAADATM